MNNEVTGAEPVSQPAGQNGPSEYINLSGELVLDPDRVIDASVAVEYKDAQAEGNSLGGIDAILSINGTPMWTKKICLLLKKKPEGMTSEQWQKAVDLVVVQSEELVKNENMF